MRWLSSNKLPSSTKSRATMFESSSSVESLFVAVFILFILWWTPKLARTFRPLDRQLISGYWQTIGQLPLSVEYLKRTVASTWWGSTTIKYSFYTGSWPRGTPKALIIRCIQEIIMMMMMMQMNTKINGYVHIMPSHSNYLPQTTGRPHCYPFHNYFVCPERRRMDSVWFPWCHYYFFFIIAHIPSQSHLQSIGITVCCCCYCCFWRRWRRRLAHSPPPPLPPFPGEI